MSAGRIRRAAEERFGPGARPESIVLTHGHFDHVGAVESLARGWDVPVYAHRLEMPYLTGRSAYPPPDSMVDGGLLARSARLYPRGPYDLGDRIQPLPEDGSIPTMPEWRWIHTPGHTAGHVSLFRERDRALLAGDAFVTTKQESALAVAVQAKRVHGPPAYFTPDWDAAAGSVRRLAALHPDIAATGHGLPMRGRDLQQQLDALAEHFDSVARPKRGRYAHEPTVMNERGVVSVPPAPPGSLPLALMAVAAGVGAAAAALWWTRRAKSRDDGRGFVAD